MKIHEFQAKEIFREHRIPVPRGVMCRTVDDVGRAYQELGKEVSVVKAQIHAGGRGPARRRRSTGRRCSAKCS